MVDKRLLAQVPHAKVAIAKTIGAKYAGLIATIMFAYSLARILTQVVEQTPLTLTPLLALCALAAIITCLSAYFTEHWSFEASRTIKLTLRSKLYAKLVRLGNKAFAHTTLAELVQTTVEGCEQLEVYFGKFLPQLVYACLAPLTLFCVLCFVNVLVAATLLVFVPLIPVIIMAIQSVAKRVMGRYWKSYTNLGDIFLENLQGLVTLKIYSADSARHRAMDEKAENFRRATMRLLTMQLNSIMVMDVAALGGAAVGIAVAYWQLTQGALDVFGVLFTVLVSAEFFIPMRTLGSYFHIAMNGMSASNNIFAFLNIPEEKRGTTELALPHNAPWNIAFHDVSFAYDANDAAGSSSGVACESNAGDAHGSGHKALSHVSLTLPSRGLYAIVGASGSGKSTIAHLIAGEYMQYTGSITLNNIPITSISAQSLARSVTTLSTTNYIFSGSVEDMLRMANPTADDAALWHALTQARIATFVQEHGGLSMHLDAQGANLSGGQKQRLCFARALLHNSNYYIFDEATSSIDVESEEHITHAMYELAKTKGVLVISHRLANTMHAARIYVMENGRVVGCGTHDELLKHCSTYETMWHKQQQLEHIRTPHEHNTQGARHE